MANSRALLDGSHRVLTPEYVEFNFVIAGLFSRFLAWMLDTLVTMMLATIVITAVSVAFIAFPGFGSALGLTIWFLIDWGYGIVLEAAWSGQTIGKRALGLRVLQESGVRITWLQAVIRNLVRPVDRLPLMYGVGGAAALFTESHQRLGDLVAGTIVVRERKLTVPSGLATDAAQAALLEDPLFRQRVARISAEEEALIYSAALRREELGMEARLSLFAALAGRLIEAHDLYKPEHLSDEKLVLLVAAELSRRSAAKARPTKGRLRNMLRRTA